MDIHTTLEGDRYVHCAYCNIHIEVGPLDTEMVQCRLCPKPTFVNNTNLQMGQPSSSIKPLSPEAPFVAKPTKGDIEQFCREEIEHIKVDDPEKTQEQAFAAARKNWASKGYEWMQQQGRQ